MKDKRRRTNLFITLVVLLALGLTSCANSGSIQEPEFQTQKGADGVTVIKTSDTLGEIIQNSKSEETKTILMDFCGPAYFESGRHFGHPPDAKELSPSSYDQDLLDEVKSLSQMEGKKFEKAFENFAKKRTAIVAEQALNNPDITLSPRFLDRYIVKYAPQYAETLQKQTDEKWKKQVPIMIEALKDAPDSIVYEESFIRDYVDRYAPQYAEMLRKGYDAKE